MFKDLEAELRDKLRRIEALFAGATTPGERIAAAAAMERIRKKLTETERVERAIEMQFTMPDAWSRRLFVALCKRYGLEPFRYRRQRYTTVMIRVPRSFVDKTLWPEFQEMNATLREYLSSVTDRVIREEVYGTAEEAEAR